MDLKQNEMDCLLWKRQVVKFDREIQANRSGLGIVGGDVMGRTGWGV
jgi:hypothetical protein